MPSLGLFAYVDHPADRRRPAVGQGRARGVTKPTVAARKAARKRRQRSR